MTQGLTCRPPNYAERIWSISLSLRCSNALCEYRSKFHSA